MMQGSIVEGYSPKERLQVVERLKAMGFRFSNKEMANLLGCTESKINNDVKKLGGKTQSQTKPKGFGSKIHAVRFKLALRIYLEQFNKEQEEEDTTEKAILEIAKKILKIEELLPHITGAGECLHNLKCRPQVKEWEGYERLLQEVFGGHDQYLGGDSPRYYRNIIKDYFLSLIDKGESLWPLSHYEMLYELRQCVIDDNEREKIRPAWIGTTTQLDELFGIVLETATPREREYLALRYGMNGKAQHTYEQIAHSFETSIERIRQIHEKVVRKLRHPKHSSLFGPLEAKTGKVEFSELLSHAKLKSLQAQASEKEVSELQTMLEKPIIEDPNLSMRARACLAKMDAKTLGDLASKTEEELLRTRSCGRKTVKEIKLMLSEHGLMLGMKIPEQNAGE